jgi:transcriptional regulator with XRE-family HTH domain
MLVGERLHELREEKNFSHGDIEKGTGRLNCYLSRVEHGHTVPTIETLEKWARALEIPRYAIFYGGKNPPGPPEPVKANFRLWGMEPILDSCCRCVRP